MVHELTTTMASHHHRSMVKPILKKLHASPKNSLDLDRGWEDQTIDLGYGGPPTSPFETTATGRSSFNLSRSATHASARASGTATPTGAGISIVGLEPSMSMSMSMSSPAAAAAAVVMGGGVGGGGGGATSAASGSVSRAGMNMNRSRYHHARSTSATSIATSNGSNHRPGASFVHPFQQTPRTNTPPLAYANSFTSFERDNNRDYSPTIITENDDDDDFSNDDFDFRASNPGGGGGGYSSSLSQSLTSNHLLHKPPPGSHPPASLRRPSLASSLGDIRSHANASASAAALSGAHKHSSSTSSSSTTQNPAPALRINTNSSSARSVPTHHHKSSKLAHGSLNTSYSHSDLQLDQQSPTDSPRPSVHLTSPSTSQAPMSPSLRTSLEGAFRLRSRSEVDTGGGRREDIREARRKFEEAERAKQEKYEAEQRRKAERKAERRKNTNGSDMSVVGRPSFSRKRTPPSTTGSQARRVPSGDSAGRAGVVNEKADGPNFMSSNYASTEDGATPNFEPDVHDIRFETPRRSRTTRRKTQSYWTSFVLWLRTRLLKLGRR